MQPVARLVISLPHRICGGETTRGGNGFGARNDQYSPVTRDQILICVYDLFLCDAILLLLMCNLNLIF